MIENKKNGESVSLIKSILTLLGSNFFSFLFTLLIMEFSIIVVLLFNGSFEFTIYLHMFEWTHTDIPYSLPEQLRWTLGYLINIGVASITYLILIRKKNQKLIPILTWAPGAFIYTSFALSAGAWTGLIPAEILTILQYTFLVIGFILTLSIRPLLYNARKIPIWNLFIINFCVFPVFITFRTLYNADYNLTNLNPSFIIAFLTIALILSLLEKPLYPLFEKIMYIRTNNIKWTTPIISCGLALFIGLIFIISPYEPYSEKIYVSDLISFIISMVLLIIGIITIVARFDFLKLEKNIIEVEITKKKKIKEIKRKEKDEKLTVVEDKLDKEELIIKEHPIELFIEQINKEEGIERVPADLHVEKIITVEELPQEEIIEEAISNEEIIEKQEISSEEIVDEKIPPLQEEIELTEVVKEPVLEKEEIIEEIAKLPTGNLICNYCGYNNPDDASYCVQCGQIIK